MRSTIHEVEERTMKTIIAGCRDFADYPTLLKAIEEMVDWEITEVVCGMAEGVDTMGKNWAEDNGIPVKPFPAKWHSADGGVDRSAGVRRNEGMGKYANALLALWDGSSSGTGHMIQYALKQGLKVRIWRIDV